jgi:hypothetical protein
VIGNREFVLFFRNVLGLVKENQLMLKGVVSNFIVLIEPCDVSASKCHPQGVPRSL